MSSIEWHKVKTYPLSKRLCKVDVKSFAKVLPKGVNTKKFLDSLPDILSGKNFKDLVKYIVLAKKRNKPVIFMHGAHLIKCGLAPLVIDLIKRGYFTMIASNGASVIHDFEIAYQGKTSEDVAASLKAGEFGMAKETAEILNTTISKAAKNDAGIGESVGKYIWQNKLPYRNYSIIGAAWNLSVPVTIHVAIGTDIIYQHPSCDGAAWGKTSYTDFTKFVNTTKKLGNGGVVLNFGSAVILPEVFLKALNLARNMGYPVTNFVTADFDMINHYRPRVNVVNRPTDGKGYTFIGYHEIMLPLLHRALIEND